MPARQDPRQGTHGNAPEHPQTTRPDYDMAESLLLWDAEQYRALFEDTRLAIINLLNERAATTSELGEALGKPKGTVGHHLKVLENAGLVRVVRTRQVRALQAKYYGRTARVFYYHRVEESAGAAERGFTAAAAELAQVPADHPGVVNANFRRVRIPTERAEYFSERLNTLLAEFSAEPRGGETTYALAFALYPTDQPALPRTGGHAFPEGRAFPGGGDDAEQEAR